MTEMRAKFPLYLENPQLGVVALPGTKSVEEGGLNEEEIKNIAKEVCQRLKPLYDKGERFTSQTIECGDAHIVGAVVEKGGVYTMYIGLGLEVIQAMQKHEK